MTQRSSQYDPSRKPRPFGMAHGAFTIKRWAEKFEVPLDEFTTITSSHTSGNASERRSAILCFGPRYALSARC